MNCKQANENISIKEVMESFSLFPSKEHPKTAYYYAINRQERTPSLLVNYVKNIAFDFGTGKQYDVVSIVQELKHFHLGRVARHAEGQPHDRQALVAHVLAHAVAIVAGDPGADEARRGGELRDALLDPEEGQRLEPGAEGIATDLADEMGADTKPRIGGVVKGRGSSDLGHSGSPVRVSWCSDEPAADHRQPIDAMTRALDAAHDLHLPAYGARSSTRLVATPSFGRIRGTLRALRVELTGYFANSGPVTPGRSAF